MQPYIYAIIINLIVTSARAKPQPAHVQGTVKQRYTLFKASRLLQF